MHQNMLQYRVYRSNIVDSEKLNLMIKVCFLMLFAKFTDWDITQLLRITLQITEIDVNLSPFCLPPEHPLFKVYSLFIHLWKKIYCIITSLIL